VSANTISGCNGGVAMWRASGTATGNQVRDSGAWGLAVGGAGADAHFDGNTISGCAHDRVGCDRASLDAIGNTISDCGAAGVSCWGEGTQASVIGNSIRRTGKHGVDSGGGVTVEARNHTVMDSARCGLSVWHNGDGRATFADNTVTGCA